MSDSERDEENNAVIIDNGTSQIRSGFGGDDAPRHIFDSIMAAEIDEPSNMYIGQCEIEQIKNKQKIKLIRPIEHGLVSSASWDYVEKLWRHTFVNGLRIDPKEHKVLMTRPILSPKSDSEKRCEILFEKFTVPSMYLISASQLSLYASARTTGIVMDCGDQITQFAPVYEGYNLPHAARVIDGGGRHITQYLQRLLIIKEINLDIDHCRKIKETLGYVAERGLKCEINKMQCDRPDWLIPAYLRSIDRNYSDRTATEIEKHCNAFCGDKEEFTRRRAPSYELPDGRTIDLDVEQFQCAELLFDSSSARGDFHILAASCDLGKLIVESIDKCDVDIREDLWRNVVITGRGGLFKGFTQRLAFDMKRQKHPKDPIREKLSITSPLHQGYAAWHGGSILTSLSTFSDMWVNAEDYEESGRSIVSRKCFD